MDGSLCPFFFFCSFFPSCILHQWDIFHLGNIDDIFTMYEHQYLAMMKAFLMVKSANKNELPLEFMQINFQGVLFYLIKTQVTVVCIYMIMGWNFCERHLMVKRFLYSNNFLPIKNYKSSLRECKTHGPLHKNSLPQYLHSSWSLA